MSDPTPRAAQPWPLCHPHRRSFITNNRGLALLAVLGAAFLLTLTVAGFIILASTHATTGRVTIEHVRARYASDAGVSWIYTQLLANPSFTPGSGTELDLPGEPQTMAVDVTVQHDISGSTSKKVQSKVHYDKL